MACMSRFRVALLAAVAAVATAGVLPKLSPEEESLNIELPDVDAIMSAATDSVTALTKQAGLLRKITAEESDAQKRYLHKTRRSYNNRLAELESENANVTSQTHALKTKLTSLETGNAAIVGNLKEAKMVHSIMRTALRKLDVKLSQAPEFLDIAVRRMHLNSSKHLEALRPLPPPPTLENFVAALEGRQNWDDEELFLTQTKTASSMAAQLKARIRAEVAAAVHQQAEDEARSILERLNRGINDITAAEDDGAMQLKANFLVKFESLQGSQKALIAERTMVQDSVNAAVARQAQLHKAGQVLREKTDELVTRLNGMRTFFNTTSLFIQEGLRKAEHKAGNNRTHAHKSHA